MSLTIGPFDKAVYLEAELSSLEAKALASPEAIQRLEAEIDRSSCVGIYRDNKCIGGAYVDPDRYFHIAVLPAHHKRWAFVFQAILEWAWLIAHPLTVIVSVQNSKVKALFRAFDYRLLKATSCFEIYEISRRV